MRNELEITDPRSGIHTWNLNTFRSLEAPLGGSGFSAQWRAFGCGTQTERVAIGANHSSVVRFANRATGYSAIREKAVGDPGGRTRGMMR
jgi:hypothetical protein